MEIEFKEKTIHVSPYRHETTKLPLLEVNHRFHFTISHSASKATPDLFTIMVYDLDAPSGVYLHYLAINYTTHDHDEGTTIVKYYPPQRTNHRYVYEVYTQKARISAKTPTIIPFNLNKYVKSNSLKKYTTLTVETQDGDGSLPPVKYHGFVHGLEEPDAKYCTCIIEVGYQRGHVNPYAVCSKSTGGHMTECGSYYDYESMPLEYLLVFTDKHNIPVRNRKSRSSAIQSIKEWKMERSHK
jgi:phosphatidylethanolamine-binding protein (PEBP) family uncharacterized protein